MEVRRNGEVVALEPKALRVLFYLIGNRERVVSKDELIQEIWEGAAVTDNSLTRVVAQIRKQLGDSAREPVYVETSPSAGYRFIGLLREASTAVAEVSPAPAAAPAARSGRRGWLLGALGAMVTGAGGLWWWQRGRGGNWVKLVNIRQLTSSAAADLWPCFSPDGSQVAFSSNRGGGFELYMRSRAEGSAERQVTRDGQENIQPVWSPDGQHLAFVSRRRGGIGLIPASGGAVRMVTETGDFPAWSPDGKRLVYRRFGMNLNPAMETAGPGESTLWVVGVEGGEAKELTKAGVPLGGHQHPRFTPDGSAVLFVANGSLWVVELATGKTEEILVAAGPVRTPAMAGENLFFVSGGGRGAGVWHGTVGAGWRVTGLRNLLPAVGTMPRDLTLSGDGRGIVMSQQAGDSAIWTVALGSDGKAKGEARPLIRDRSFRNSEPGFSADGERLVYSSVRLGGEWAVLTAKADGSGVEPLTASEESGGRPSWFGDGSVGYRVAEKGAWSYWIRPLEGAARRLTLRMDLGKADRMRLSPDGGRMAAHVTGPGGMRVVVEDLKTGVVRELTGEGVSVGFPCWSPDGKWIAAGVQAGGNTTLVVMGADGGGMKKIETGMTQSFANGWSPDGKRVVFAGLREGVWGIYWVSRDGGAAERLFEMKSKAGFVRYPAWSPKGDQVVFEYNDVTANVYVGEVR